MKGWGCKRIDFFIPLLFCFRYSEGLRPFTLRNALEKEKLLEYPELFRTPIVRNGKDCTVGYCPEQWAAWQAADKK